MGPKGDPLRSFIFAIDKFSLWVGHAFAWSIMAMTFGVGYEVFVRYVLRDPTAWAFDLSYMMYGTLFMMGGAYTLSRDAHVRGDVFYRMWKPRTQGIVELTLYILFFYPAVLALIFAGWTFAHQSIGYREVSVMSPANVPIFHFKLIIPAAGIMLFIQGLAQVSRCIIAIRENEWPGLIADVEETETMILHQTQDHAEVQSEINGSKGAGR